MLQHDEVLDLLTKLLNPPSWHADAACREHPEVNYSPALGERSDEAKAICAGCLVRPECLAYAVESDEQHGVWGGHQPEGPTGAQTDTEGRLTVRVGSARGAVPS